MVCQPMSGHHLPFRLSRKCSKLIISTALPPRSRASPAPQIRFGWAHPEPVIMTLACVSNRHYYYYIHSCIRVATSLRFLESRVESCMSRVESESYWAGLDSRVQQVTSPSPGVCGSSPSQKERKFSSSSTRHFP